MTDINLSYIVVVLDRSGSMSSIKTDTEGGFNTFIEEQKKLPGRCLVTLAQFDDHYDVVYSNLPLSDVPKLTLLPRGSTALFDAIGKTVVAKGEELAALSESERPAVVEVLVLTDGWENASREWTGDRVKELVEKQTNQYNWKFTFMGSNQDAVLVGGTLGFTAGNSLTYSGQNVGVAFANAARSSVSYRGSVASGATYDVATAASVFTDDERDASI